MFPSPLGSGRTVCGEMGTAVTVLSEGVSGLLRVPLPEGLQGAIDRHALFRTHTLPGLVGLSFWLPGCA